MHEARLFLLRGTGCVEARPGSRWPALAAGTGGKGMIIKVMGRKAGQSVSDARAQLRYIRAQREQDSGAGRDKLVAGCGGATGFGLAGDADAVLQDMLLERLISENRACRKPLVHALISWNSGVRPTKDAVREAVGVWLQEVGASGLPAVWEAHGNTANFHVHVVLCRLDPELGGRARDLGLFKLGSQRAKARIEALQNLRACAGDLYVPSPEGVDAVKKNLDARYWKAGRGALDVLPALSSGARDMEHRTGKASAETVAREVAWPRIASAPDWAAVHEALAEVDCRLLPRKGGLVLMVGDEPVKASKVNRACSRRAMEERLGAYEPPKASAAAESSKAEPGPVQEPCRPRPQGVRKPKASVAKPEEQGVPLMEEWPRPLPEKQEPPFCRHVRPAPGMDDELEAAWLEFLDAAEKAARDEKMRTAFWKEEFRQLKARMLQERMRVLELVQEARAAGLRYRRVFLCALRQGVLRLGRELRMELAAARRAERAGSPRPVPSFADWLDGTGRQELASRWRRRLSAVPGEADAQGGRRRILAALAEHEGVAGPAMQALEDWPLGRLEAGTRFSQAVELRTQDVLEPSAPEPKVLEQAVEAEKLPAD
ncbi:MAG: hypothetical protein K6C33_02005, partial [Desulfovibrio sp.]|nr:hypothetical protein [Desulfovibrio sp.]